MLFIDVGILNSIKKIKIIIKASITITYKMNSLKKLTFNRKIKKHIITIADKQQFKQV